MADPGSYISWAAGKKTVLCVGHNTIDYISIVRQFPAENGYQRCLRGYTQRGGNASNNCTVLRNLGVKCEFFGMLSNSSMFRIHLDDFKKRDIIIENCPRCDLDPPFSSVFLTKSTQTRNIVSCNKSFPYVSPEDFQKLDLYQYGWIHFSGVHFNETLAMMRQVDSFNERHPKEHRITVSLEFDRSLDEMFPLVDYADYVLFSKQLADQQGWQTPQKACNYLDKRFSRRWCPNVKRPLVVFLWGKLGAGYLDEKGNYSLAKAYKPKKVVDALGAGDTFIAAFIYAIYIRDRSFAKAVDFGNRMASYKCTKYGYDHIANILIAPVLFGNSDKARKTSSVK